MLEVQNVRAWPRWDLCHVGGVEVQGPQMHVERGGMTSGVTHQDAKPGKVAKYEQANHERTVGF
jgi:hypothetical protein